tara:strand:+ start:2810 stop:3520 length:711 start_codon:yes stop_codon:yes gene_type:complete
MKNRVVVLFLLVIASITAQNEVSVTLEKIEILKVHNGLTVNLIKSDEQKLEITGEKAGDVTFKNKKGTLKIGFNKGSSEASKKLKINLYYNSFIGELDASQGSVITSKEIFKQQQLSVISHDVSHIMLTVEIDYIKIKGLSGGNIQLKGFAKSQNINLVTGARYKGFDLESGQANLYVSTGSNAEVYATEVLDAKSKFGGKIFYKGRPKSVTIEESLGGKVTKAQIETEKKEKKSK